MYTITYGRTFKEDYRRVTRRHPQVAAELRAAVAELMANGTLPSEYRPHALNKPGGNYSGHMDFHLLDGEVDVVVLYLPYKMSPIIRLVRMGSHGELFQGPLS